MYLGILAPAGLSSPGIRSGDMFILSWGQICLRTKPVEHTMVTNLPSLYLSLVKMATGMCTEGK